MVYGSRNSAGLGVACSLLLGAAAITGAAAAEGEQVRAFPELTDKTLVAWVQVTDLDQRGGSALTIEDGSDRFDAIVFGERTPRRWMAGSDGFRRSQSPEAQSSNPAEDTEPEARVQMAVVYRGDQVTVFRNAQEYASYSVDSSLRFGAGSFVVLGLRHVVVGELDCFAGAIEDARIYDIALTHGQIAALEPNVESDPEPLAWWGFEEGRVTDRMGMFPNTRLFGQVKVSDGGLHLDGRGSYLVAARTDDVPAWRGRPSRGSAPDADLVSHARALRRRLLADPHRPAYHVVAPEGLCGPFDPNAALFWKGRYHLMTIVQTHRGHCFAHVSSTDLVHWRHHPLALEPGNGDAGIFSGGAALNADGVPTITYWGLGDPGGICVATSTDDLLETWTKSPHNPVIRETQHGLAVSRDDAGKDIVYGAADPSAVWLRDGRTYLLTGNLLVLREYGLKRKLPEHRGDTAYLFVSDDLADWQYLGPFYQSRREWTRADEDDMCPDFFPLPASPDGGAPSDRHMLLFISHNLGCQYYVGRYADDSFEPETHGRMTWADNAFFAPESLVDGRGRRIMWAWIFDGRGREARAASMWSGTLSLPRVLWLGDDATLRMRPAEELAALRYHPRERAEVALAPDEELPLGDVRGNSLELELTIDPGTAEQVGMKVCRTADGREQTAVFYDAQAEALTVDARESSLADGPRNLEAGPLELAEGEQLRLRLFVDRSVVEAFANDRQAVMRRIYPSRADAVGVSLFARGGEATVRLLRAWEMAAANPW